MYRSKIFFCILMMCSARISSSQWVAPDAWGRAEHNAAQSSVYPACNCQEYLKDSDFKLDGHVEADITSIFYGKLIKFIFNRNRMSYDDSSESFSRPIIFKISAKQLDILEKSRDLRDWDSVLAEVLPRAEFPKEIIANDLIADIISATKFYLSSFFVSSEIRFTLILLASVLGIMYLSRKYNTGLVAIVLIGLFLFGYIHSYYDCNRELQIKELVNMEIKKNPCDERQQDVSFWNFFQKKVSKQQCIEHLINKNKIKLPYCKPDDVMVIYIHNIFFQQMHLFLQKSTDIVKKCVEDIPFPYNIVAMLIFGLTLPQFLKLFFKYILTPSVWRTNQNLTTHTAVQMEDKHNDRLSGENLNLFLKSIKTHDQYHSSSDVEIIDDIPLKSFIDGPTTSNVKEIEIVNTKTDKLS